MRKGEQFWQRIAEHTDLTEESFPGQPVVEIAGTNRVLIENHLGVKGYSRECIMIRVKYGFIQICGTCLEVSRMTREQLLIRGKIDQICLQRGC